LLYWLCLTIAGSEFDTDEDGEATVEVRNSELPSKVEYHTTQFWDRNKVAYTPSEIWVNGQTDLGFAISPLVRIVGILVVFWSPFYVLDRMFDGDYWPPWREVW